MNRFREDWRLIVLALYAVAVGALMLWAGEPGTLSWWPAAAGFWLFALVPVGILCIGARNKGIKGFGAAMMALGGIWGFYTAMFGADASSTSALVFAVLPFYQLVAALAFLLLLWIIDRFQKEENS